jgi:hypothetical protein
LPRFRTECFRSAMRPRIAFALKWAISKKRRVDACALPKSRDCGTKQNRRCRDFARSALGVRCVFASLLRH